MRRRASLLKAPSRCAGILPYTLCAMIDAVQAALFEREQRVSRRLRLFSGHNDAGSQGVSHHN